MHKFIYDDVKQGYDTFVIEKKYHNKWWFKIENYEDMPLRITSQVLLTTYHIDNKYNEPDCKSSA